MANMYSRLSKELFQILKGSGRSLYLFDDNGNQVWEPLDARKMFCEPDKLMVSVYENGSDSEVKIYFGNNVDISNIKGLIDTIRILVTRFNVLLNIKKYGKELSVRDFSNPSKVTEGIINKQTRYIIDSKHFPSLVEYLESEYGIGANAYTHIGSNFYKFYDEQHFNNVCEAMDVMGYGYHSDIIKEYDETVNPDIMNYLRGYMKEYSNENSLDTFDDDLKLLYDGFIKLMRGGYKIRSNDKLKYRDLRAKLIYALGEMLSPKYNLNNEPLWLYLSRMLDRVENNSITKYDRLVLKQVQKLVDKNMNEDNLEVVTYDFTDGISDEVAKEIYDLLIKEKDEKQVYNILSNKYGISPYELKNLSHEYIDIKFSDYNNVGIEHIKAYDPFSSKVIIEFDNKLISIKYDQLEKYLEKMYDVYKLSGDFKESVELDEYFDSFLPQRYLQKKYDEIESENQLDDVSDIEVVCDVDTIPGDQGDDFIDDIVDHDFDVDSDKKEEIDIVDDNKARYDNDQLARLRKLSGIR